MVESMLSFTSICEAANVTGVAEFDVVSLKWVVDSIGGRAGVVESILSFTSVWEA